MVVKDFCPNIGQLIIHLIDTLCFSVSVFIFIL